MSISSSYSEVFSLAERVRDKFATQHGAKDQNLRLIIAHARLYDILDDHIDSLKKRRRLNANSFQINQQGRHHTRKRQGPDDTPPILLDLPAECAAEDDEDPDTPSSPLTRTPSVSISELQTSNRKGKTSSPHGSPSLIETHCTKMSNNSPYSADYKTQAVISETPVSDSLDSDSNPDSNSDSDSDSDSNSDYDGDLESDFSFPTQKIKGTLHPRIRQDHDTDEGPNSSDILAQQDLPKAEDFPTLQRFASSVTQPLSSPSVVEPEEPKIATTHTPSPTKTSPLAPLLCDDGSDISSASGIHHIKNQQLLQQALHQLLDHPRDDAGNQDTAATAITSTISRMFPSLAEWVRRRDGGKIGV